MSTTNEGNTDEGFWDHALGSTDEAVARTFDDEPGGGIIDGTVETADHVLGSTDEAVARTFDDEPGGGIIDGTVETVTLGIPLWIWALGAVAVGIIGLKTVTGTASKTPVGQAAKAAL